METDLLTNQVRVCEILHMPRGVTALVGGGGKTSLMRVLSRELAETGARVIVSTTTRIYPVTDMPTLPDPVESEIQAALEKSNRVCVGKRCENGKLGETDVPIAALEAMADYVLFEADGAKRMPVKTPLDHEPVLPPSAKLVVAVAGLDALGMPLCDCMFRYARYCERTKASPDTRLTEAMLAALLTHDDGGRKGVLPGMRFAIMLNKADDEARVRRGRETARLIDEACAERVLIGALARLL